MSHRQLDDELKAKLALLRSAPIEFSPEQQCFVLDGRRRPGLTKILTNLLPVPRARRQADNVVDSARVATIAKYRGNMIGSCSTCDAAVRWGRSVTEAECSTLAAHVKGERNADRAHGIIVDYQLALYVRCGWRGLLNKCRVVDPCVGTLLEHLETRGLSLIAAQTPIYDARTGVATAIDGLVTDRETRRQLIALELKIIRARRVRGAENDANYECVRGVITRGPLRGLGQSYLMRHQLQLLSMCDAVASSFPFKFDGALLLRVSPGTVRSYKLMPDVSKRATDLVDAIGDETGKRKTKRRAEAVQAPGAKRKRIK